MKRGYQKALKCFGNFQLGCGTDRGAETAAHSFRNLIGRDDNTKCTVLLKLGFSNECNSLIEKTMLNKLSLNRPELYKYTHSAYSKPSNLLSQNSILMVEDGT